MAKLYTMGSKLATLGLLDKQPAGKKSKYADLQGPVAVKTSKNYVYDGSVLPKKAQKAYDAYHASKGKIK